MKFFCIADNASGIGFRLAGVETREVSTRTEALEALKVARAKEDVGVIIVTEKAASFIRKELEGLTYSKRLPLILEIPSRGQPKKPENTGEILKKAIGISV